MSEHPITVEKIVEIGKEYGKDIDTTLSKTDMLKQLEEHIGSLSKEQLNELSRIAS